jgi:hypothetical protein
MDSAERMATTNALTRGERLERKRASLLKRVRRALVFVLLILTHVAGAWLCVVF